jgi:hypothetical protein
MIDIMLSWMQRLLTESGDRALLTECQHIVINYDA